ncbi:MAG: hypothetical protein MCSN_0080 [Candidatus Microsyncoccus archaeolyticus]|nr:MAG: hypothetical protein MCSN_0080 [Candidatus Parcubacteria bacterium]
MTTLDLEKSSSYGTKSMQIGFWLILLYGSIGYYVYGGLNGVFSMIILGILYSFSCVLAFIPFAGIGVQYWAMSSLIFPWVQNLAGIEATWLTQTMFWITIVFGVIYWIIWTVYVASIIYQRYEYS